MDELANEVIRLRHGELLPTTAAQRELPAAHSRVETSDYDLLLKRAAAYIDALPPAISGQGGHNMTFTAATALVHGFGLTQADALDMLATRYNPRCDPEWSERELQHKVAEAAQRPHSKPFGWLKDSSRLPIHAAATQSVSRSKSSDLSLP